MRTIKLKIYSFRELSEEAKETAIDNYVKGKIFDLHVSFLQDEVNDTANAFMRQFPVKISYHCRRMFTNMEFYGDIWIEDLKGLRLRTYILNNFGEILYKPRFIYTGIIGQPGIQTGYSKIQKDNTCVLTGACWDDSLLEPIYEFIEKYDDRRYGDTTFDDLIRGCGENLLYTYNREVEYRQSDEYIRETLTESDYEFLEDGTEYTG